MPVIKADCDATTKAAFNALAERENLTEAQLLRRLIEQRLATAGESLPPPPRRPAVKGKLDVRLHQREADQVRALAEGEGITVSRWVRGLVRRRLDRDVVPFNPAELQAVREATQAVGGVQRLFRSLHDHARNGGAVDLRGLDVTTLMVQLQAASDQVWAVLKRAASRYDTD